MIDLERATKIAQAAGNSHGADMLKDAIAEIKALREKLAETEKNKAQAAKVFDELSEGYLARAGAAEARLAEVEKELEGAHRAIPIEYSQMKVALAGAGQRAERLRAALNAVRSAFSENIEYVPKLITILNATEEALAADSAAPSEPLFWEAREACFIHEWDHDRTVCMRCGFKGDTGEQGGSDDK